jgi:uncharacterized delta-60 repeat protein
LPNYSSFSGCLPNISPSFSTYVYPHLSMVRMLRIYTFLAFLFISNFAIADIGDLDSAFNPGADDDVVDIAIQSDGKILVAGYFGTIGGGNQPLIARLNADGTLDSAFAPEVTGTSPNVNSIAIQSDGKILIGGDFDTVNGETHDNIARLNSDGTIDSSLTTDVGGEVNVMTLQADGKILIGGNFSTVNATGKLGFARLLSADGSLDNTFATSVDGAVRAIALESDGEIVIGGTFQNVNSTARNRVARVDSEGDLDSTFNPNSNGLVLSIAIQSDGKVLPGGSFTTISSAAREGIARINADGSFDSSFNVYVSAGGPSFVVNTVAAQADGKILLGGTFNYLESDSRAGMGRINADLTLDTGFDQGVNSAPNKIVLQDDGRVIVGGTFFQFTNPVTSRNRLARLEGGAPNAAPSGVSATAGDALATVAWSALTGEITSYTATASPGGAFCSATSPTLTCEVTGLTNNTAYTFTVVAINDFGAGPASEESNSVIPLAPTPTPTPEPTATPTPSVCFGGVLDAPTVQKKGSGKATVRLPGELVATDICVVTLRGQLLKSKKKVSKLLATGKKASTFKKLSKGKWRFFYSVRSTELQSTQTSVKRTVSIK